MYGWYYLSENVILREEDLVALLTRHADLLSIILGKKVLVNPKVLRAIIVTWRRFKVPYCPCRFEKKSDTICPCIYHIQELIRYGRCKCKLFYIASNCSK